MQVPSHIHQAASVASPQNPSRRAALFVVRARGRIVLVVGVLWLAVLGTGFALLAREEFTPAAATAARAQFPSKSSLILDPAAPTLILFAHPHCPCTRATFHEFAELLASLPHPVAATVVFPVPEGTPPHWEQGDLWQLAARMPNVRVVADRDGGEARRFGVKGSGHVLLYQPSGQLAFSGGITASRGHEGDNPGCAAIVSLVLHGSAPVSQTPVFGCPLLEPPAPPVQP